MTGQQLGVYKDAVLRRLGDGTPIYGVLNPDGEWRQWMGAPAIHVCQEAARAEDAELNQIHGLVP
ncbi:hypothetical protein EDD38_3238 [Kitasatospora cineracea]|uniref:Uncharacterized protein n=1 Tax=Kitasatospora cineracea TaxID=88074 RepID=A0A3N4RPZ8_9ACTN|nr:hypothetical protein EDD38_3238 [Kitasatospora cineracea]